MKKLFVSLAVVAVAVTSCQKDVVYNDMPKQNQSVELSHSNTRSYEEALAVAEDALKLLEGDETRSTTKRVIKRNEGQTVMRPVTRGSETSEEPIMYVFNNEDNMGFTVVAADRSQQPLIAVTEYGNYTFGEPTGVEPFDLLMEDVATTLAIIDEPMAIKEETIILDESNHYGPLTNVQWGTGTIYGAMYPDGIAYDEATAIAQAMLCTTTDATYLVTNPNSVNYGQIITLNKSELGKHIRYNYHGLLQNGCTTSTHNQISELFLEIGYRLSNGTSINLANKNQSFPLSKVQNVLSSFGADVDYVQPYSSYHIQLLANPIYEIYDPDVFVFRGVYKDYELIPTNAHTWISTGHRGYIYEVIEYTLNKFIDPSHPNPNGYTETNRVRKYDYILYINWGYDGHSNGWFNSGCFDMSKRIESDAPSIIEPMPTLNYNFVNIQSFKIDNIGYIIY